MQYIDLKNEDEFNNAIQTVKSSVKNLSQIFIPDKLEKTSGERVVLTLFYKMEPVIKVEGYEDIVEKFIEKLKFEQTTYYKV